MQAVVLDKTAKQGHPCVCKPGCGACCYEPVYVSRGEMEHALGRMTPQARKKVKANLLLWLDKIEPSGLLAEEFPNAFKWRALRAPCPFFEPTPGASFGRGSCAIYADRPSSCRVHCAIGPPENCYDDEKRKGQIFMHSPQVIDRQAITELQESGKVELDNLGPMLARILLGREVPSASFQKHDRTEVAQALEVLQTIPEEDRQAWFTEALGRANKTTYKPVGEL